MVKEFMVHGRRILKLAVILTFVSKYFVVSFPTRKTTFFPLEKIPAI